MLLSVSHFFYKTDCELDVYKFGKGIGIICIDLSSLNFEGDPAND